MEKTLFYENNSGLHRFNIRASVYVLIKYKEQFGTEYFSDYNDIPKDPKSALTVGYRLVWAMAKCADESIPDPDVFINDLGEFDIVHAVECASDIMLRSLGKFCKDNGESQNSGNDEDMSHFSESLTSSALKHGFSVDDLNKVGAGFLLETMTQRINAEKEALRSTDGTQEATQEQIEGFKTMMWGR